MLRYIASEELPVRYYNPLDKKYHRYFPDFVIKTSNQDKFMIEIKPSRQTKKPNEQKKTIDIYVKVMNISRTSEMFSLNLIVVIMKKFKIITEKELANIN